MGETYAAGTARQCRRRPNGVSNNGYISGSGFSNVDGLCVRSYCLFISSYYYPSSGYSWITGACVTTTTTTTTSTTTTSTTTTTSSTAAPTSTTTSSSGGPSSSSTTTSRAPTSSTSPCWVAQTVYGIDNPKWFEFRNWLFGPDETPRLDTWLQRSYMKYGQTVAKFISNKPVLKWIIRKLMDRAIK